MHTMEPSSANQNQGSDTSELFRWRVLLEPKGFIRLIEFVLAVLTFATTAGYSSYMSYQVTCQGIYHNDRVYSFGYPFNFKDFEQLCVVGNNTVTMSPDHPTGKAEFFVAIAVLAMLYSIVTLIWYVIFEVKFFNFDLIPVADLVLTAAFALFFFLASCAWASGVTTVKYWTNFDNIVKEFYSTLCDNPIHKCVGDVNASYASLNASIMFGFLNIVVWAGNCWFVYKETSLFKDRQAQTQKETQPETPPNDV